MQDADLFMELAGIAGVFVGFGALIAVRSGSSTEAGEVLGIRWLVSVAMWVVVAALTPVIVSRYDISGHALWATCSLLALVLFLGVGIVNRRTPEAREDAAAMPRPMMAREMTANSLLVVPMITALLLVVLGPFPDHEPALYLTAVGLGLFLDALVLLYLVFSQRRPQTAPDPAALPATGGSTS